MAVSSGSLEVLAGTDVNILDCVRLYFRPKTPTQFWAEGVHSQIFDALHEHKAEIETAFGEPLEWQRLDAKRACRVRYVLTDGGLQDQQRWPKIQDAMIEAMIRLERAMKPQIHRLKLG